ncbi:unnamed protein product [Orchesella dallaii]|uniref:DUF243 domain-containing protein n=1 Tax=Orchesella dallaii TaxID=48710 RepID=A0ABP1RFK4_9HEXA
MNGDRSLAREELTHCLKGCIYMGYGIDNDELDECERDIIEIGESNVDKDAQITETDFQNACYEDPLLLQACGPCLPPDRSTAAFLALITDKYRNFTQYLNFVPIVWVWTCCGYQFYNTWSWSPHAPASVAHSPNKKHLPFNYTSPKEIFILTVRQEHLGPFVDIMKLLVVLVGTITLVGAGQVTSGVRDAQGRVINNEILRSNRRIFASQGGWGNSVSDSPPPSSFRGSPPPGFDGGLMNLFNAMSSFGLGSSYGPPGGPGAGGGGRPPSSAYGPPGSGGAGGGGRPPSSAYGPPGSGGAGGGGRPPSSAYGPPGSGGGGGGRPSSQYGPPGGSGGGSPIGGYSGGGSGALGGGSGGGRPSTQYGPPGGNGGSGGGRPSGGYSGGGSGGNGGGGNGGYSGGGNGGASAIRNGGGGALQVSTRSRGNGAGGGNGGGAGGGNGGGAGGDGAPRIFRYVSLFTAPDDPAPTAPKVVRAGPATPDKHVNIIFVRPPTPAGEQPTEVVLGPEPERKTIVYVLMKKPTEGQETVRVRPAPPTQPPRPEVFFIPFSDPSAQNGGGPNGGDGSGGIGGIGGGGNGNGDGGNGIVETEAALEVDGGPGIGLGFGNGGNGGGGGGGGGWGK